MTDRQTDRPTERPKDRQTDGPTKRGTEAPGRSLKILCFHEQHLVLNIFGLKSFRPNMILALEMFLVQLVGH